jgi:uncharacterized tellurite resistance protein B-like protein
MLILGTRTVYRTVGRGIVLCERCGGDRPYRRRSGRRWWHALGIPLIPLARAGEHLRCTACRTCYRVDLLAVPTLEQMQAALLAGTTAAVLAVLGSDTPSVAAERRAVELVRRAGGDGFRAADLADAQREFGQAQDRLGPAIERLAVQLDCHAREWFLSGIIGVARADGPLSARQRAVIGSIARYLGISQKRAQDVIRLT